MPPPRRRQSRRQPASIAEARLDQLLDDFDAATAAADAARVQALTAQLWRARRQVPEALTRRIEQDRAQVPAMAFELIITLGGAQAPTYLRRIAGQPTLPDIVRWGAQRRAGWPERGEAKRRVAFLDSLRDPEATLVVAVDQAMGFAVPDMEILTEVLGYLRALPVKRRRAALERIAATLDDEAAPLLFAVLHLDDPPTQRIALRELLRVRPVGAEAAVDRLARTARTEALRAEAAAAAQRLQLHVVDADAPPPAELGPPVLRVLLSMLDGDGGQIVIVVRDWGLDTYLVADVFHNESGGIKEALGFLRMSADSLEEMLDDFAEQGVELVEVDLAAARGVLAAAMAVNAATGQSLPPELELWEPFFHDVYPPAPDEPVDVPELDDAPYVRRADLLRASGRLADHPFCQNWQLDPAGVAAQMNLVEPPPDGRLRDREFRPMLAALVDNATRNRLRHRLRRQAWLLDRAGETAARDQALAVAAHLARATPAELTRLPFLRHVLQRSVDLAVAEMVAAAYLRF